VTSLLGALLLPPLNLVLLALAGVLLRRRHPRTGRALVWLAGALLCLLSTPFFADTALRQLEPPPAAPRLNSVQAIVVLGAGTYFEAPEYGASTVDRLGLERVRYAARLHRLTGRPILASGGSPRGGDSSEAAQMRAALQQDFQVPVAWVEEASRTTRENAHRSAAILDANGITRIALVTHAWHMQRASREFELAGLEVVPAATAYTTRRAIDLHTFLPAAGALQRSGWFFHEVIGMLWYRLLPAPAST
jgi:uncharacterized SAM-binding protein YcdF (DUF218 family)